MSPWSAASVLAGLLLLGTADGLMAYGAPSHASTLGPSSPGQSPPEGTLVSATAYSCVAWALGVRIRFLDGLTRA